MTIAAIKARPLKVTVAEPEVRALFSPDMLDPGDLVLVGASVDGALVVAGTPAVGSDGAAVVGLEVVGADVGQTLHTGHPVRLLVLAFPHGHGPQVGSGVC